MNIKALLETRDLLKTEQFDETNPHHVRAMIDGYVTMLRAALAVLSAYTCPASVHRDSCACNACVSLHCGCAVCILAKGITDAAAQTADALKKANQDSQRDTKPPQQS